MERIREYQLQRLRYHYAVLQFATADDAARAYEHCDGVEYETSGTRIDLR